MLSILFAIFMIVYLVKLHIDDKNIEHLEIRLTKIEYDILQLQRDIRDIDESLVEEYVRRQKHD